MALFTFHQVHGNCIERGEKSKVFLHVGNANQVSIGFPTWKSKCYAFSRFQKNVPLGDFPAIRYLKGSNAVLVILFSLTAG